MEKAFSDLEQSSLCYSRPKMALGRRVADRLGRARGSPRLFQIWNDDFQFSRLVHQPFAATVAVFGAIRRHCGLGRTLMLFLSLQYGSFLRRHDGEQNDPSESEKRCQTLIL